MIDARFVPIRSWPGARTTFPLTAKFRASYADTLELLERELEALDAKNVTIQAYFSLEDIRNDGWPRSSARPSAAGVIVSFDVRKWDPVKRVQRISPLSFPCDTYNDFDDNLRAIALTLEALRKVTRYGVSQRNEQYTGWAQLPPSSNGDETMTRERAVEFIAAHSGMPVVRETLNEAYRRAAARLHPDNKQTGSHELFVKLQKAREVLDV